MRNGLCYLIGMRSPFLHLLIYISHFFHYSFLIYFHFSFPFSGMVKLKVEPSPSTDST